MINLIIIINKFLELNKKLLNLTPLSYDFFSMVVVSMVD